MDACIAAANQAHVDNRQKAAQNLPRLPVVQKLPAVHSWRDLLNERARAGRSRQNSATQILEFTRAYVVALRTVEPELWRRLVTEVGGASKVRLVLATCSRTLGATQCACGPREMFPMIVCGAGDDLEHLEDTAVQCKHLQSGIGSASVGQPCGRLKGGNGRDAKARGVHLARTRAAGGRVR